MITSNEATRLIQEFSLKNLENHRESISFQQSLHRVLAEDIAATYDQPPFDRVSMDGIAINFEALSSTTKFIVEGVQAAGQETIKLINSSNCLEVMTGATLPLGCNTVIPYEEIEIKENSARILNPGDITRSQNIHDRGSDYKKNSLLISKNSIINFGQLSIIASSGVNKVQVFKVPKIAIISTGDELVEPGLDLLPHQIYRSNPYALNALFSAHHLSVETLAHLADNQEIMLVELKRILSSHRVIVLTGGVSKGKFDFLPSVLADLGVKQIFHKVKHRPGKPLLFGLGPENQLIFGLPGNPVSCVVNLRKYIIPVLKNNFKATMHVKIAKDINLKKDMTFFIPAKLEFSNDGFVIAVPLQGNGSGDFYSLRDSDGFLEVDNLDNKNKFSAGNILPFYHWNY